MTERTAGAHRRLVTPSIRMGEIAVGNGTEPLRTLLGSCIGLALYDRRGKVGGLAHVVLPDSRGHDGPPGKFIDTAIPELMRQIEEHGGVTSNLAAKIAGGARMFQTEVALTIGDQNLETIQRELKSRGIPIVASHCGGDSGRRMTFFPDSGRVCIDVVGCETIEI